MPRPRRSTAVPASPTVQSELPGFRVALANFEGPFDLLLQLIGSKKMDITEVSLSAVTDEFIAYTRSLSGHDRLEETTEFLVVAAILLDLKAARLLPRPEGADIEDLELLESRDLLFARLLQYKAYKQVAELLGQWVRSASRSYPRAVGLEEPFAALLPPVVIRQSVEEFAQLAAAALRPHPPEEVGTSHIHQVAVSVPEQAGKILGTLKLAGVSQWLSFGRLVGDCTVSMQVVGRFLALLELYKSKAIEVRQEESLGPLDVSWTGLDVDPAVVASANWE